MVSYGGYGGPGPTDIASSVAETLSLVLITLSFLLMLYLFVRVRTWRSLQFEMFVFVLVLMLAETPRILLTLGIMVVGLTEEETGFVIHTISMVILSSLVAFRTYQYFKRGKKV